MGSLPCIYLPGGKTFVSCKNSLQEYCQKLKIKCPEYKVIQDENGFYTSVVTVTGFHQHSAVPCKNVKEAEQRAAFLVLQKIGYINESVSFQMAVQKHNISESPVKETQQTPSKVVNWKNQLNEFVQKHRLSQPSYQTVSSLDVFSSTVLLNGDHFKSVNFHVKKKDAEQDAAHEALKILCDAGSVQRTKESLQREVPIVSKSHKSFKSLLQEYCQRHQTQLPKYSVRMDSEYGYIAVVTIDDEAYHSMLKTTKKEAESSAAFMALQFLGVET